MVMVIRIAKEANTPKPVRMRL
jgi:small subunit ribosomal protein S13